VLFDEPPPHAIKITASTGKTTDKRVNDFR